MATAASSDGAASADAASSVCMGSSAELVAVLTPSVIEEIDWTRQGIGEIYIKLV